MQGLTKEAENGQKENKVRSKKNSRDLTGPDF